MTVFRQMLRRQFNPIIAAIVSAAVLISTLAIMIQGRVAILRSGAEVVLKAGPVDPRDLMRGDYVRLRYDDISQADGALLEAGWPKEDAYVPLWLTLVSGEDGLAKVTSIDLEKPNPGPADAVYLKSEPVMVYAIDKDRARNVMFSLQFGIERYYVPEGEGLEIEAARNQDRTTVAVRVSETGEPQIARLMIDGETLYNEPLY